MRAAAAVLGLLLVAPLRALQESAASCKTCHPGSLKGLAQSVHRSFVERPPETGTCTSCHRGTEEHVASASLPAKVVSPPRVTPQACLSCHPGRKLEPAGAVHRYRKAPETETRPAEGPQAADGGKATEGPDHRAEGLVLHGSLAGGYREVNVSGSQRRFDEDLNLDSGFRLKEAMLTGRGPSGQGFFDRFSLEAHDVDDPYQTYRGELARSGLYRLKGGFEKTTYTYDPGLDYHMYDMDRKKSYAGGDVDLGDKWKLFTHLERLERDGIVVTSRIGNQNVQPLVPVENVRGPRSLTYDFAEAGVSADLGRTEISFSGEWHDEDARDQRSWSRTSAVNPSFPESEVSRTDWSLRGPGARLTLRSDLLEDGSLDFAMALHYRDLDRRTVTDSTVRGYDIGEFVTQTDGVSKGTGQTFLRDFSLTWQAHKNLSFIADLRWLLHSENQDLDLVDVTDYPSLGTRVVTDRSTVLTTRQEVLEGSLATEVKPAESLTLTVGYGYALEKLRLPDLEPGDTDFQSGKLRTEGFLGGALWTPGKRWTLSADFRGFGMGKTQLTEISPDMGTTLKERARYRGEGWSVEVSGRHRHAENDQSKTRMDSNSGTLLLVLEPSESFWVHASQTETWIDSTTLTNFYFAPDPSPIPTRVGFDGRTDSTVVGFVLRPMRHIAWTNDVGFTNTTGDFDVRFLHFITDLTFEVSARAEIGFEGRVVNYNDERAPPLADYDALIGTVYARLRF